MWFIVTESISENRFIVPVLGERRLEQFTLAGSYGPTLSEPEPCIVTQINYEHHVYTVYFDRLGFYESYRFPVEEDVLPTLRDIYNGCYEGA